MRHSNLPTFLVIGAAKSGTTSLHRYLKQHPEIFVHGRREPSFFAHEGEALKFRGPGDQEWKFVTEIEDYRNLFRSAASYRAVGDVSPRYLYFERACQRINRYVPNAQIIAILRHPVDRAYSHFLMNRDRNCEPEARFAIAIQRETERFKKGWGWDWQYVRAGLYYEQLSRYYNLFPRKNIRIYLYEDFDQRLRCLFRDLFTFLDVDKNFEPDTALRDRKASLTRSHRLQQFLHAPSGLKTLAKHVVPSGISGRLKVKASQLNGKRPAPLSADERNRLFKQYFFQDCLRLETLIDRDLSNWIGSA